MDEVIDWDKFKSEAKGWNLSQAKKSYIELCELVNKNNHKLLTEYIGNSIKVLIDFNCGHEPHWITPSSYKKGQGCPKCSGVCTKQAKEKFLKMLNNNGHKLASEYTNNSIKVLIDFNCGHEPHWIRPYDYKNGTKCPKCSGNCSEQAKEDLFKLVKKNNHKLLSEYVNTMTKVLIDFNCGHKPHWITPKQYKKGQGCPKCSGVCPAQAKNDLLNMLKENNHKLLSKYINSSIKVLIDFNCGHEPHWIRPSSYKRGDGCPGCSGLCPAQAKNDLLNILKENNHKLLSKYTNALTKVLIDFNCGHEPHWIIPSSYKKGTGCPRCSGNCSEQAKEKFLKMLNNNGHKLASEYTNALTKVLIDFNCGHKPHWIRPNSYKNGQGCPKCVHKGERELYELLLNMNYKVETQKTYNDLKHKDYLKYDFYLPEYNLLIELDGEHHREKVIYKNKNKTELEKYLAEIKANERLQNTQYKDKLKNDYAKDNNIPLLRIEYSNSIVELDKWKKLIEDKIKEINFH